MFWCKIIRNKYKFCSCEAAWRNFTIVNVIIPPLGFLDVYVTPDDGNRCLLFRMREGETIPFKSKFVFAPYQHVKFEAIGGDVVVVGEVIKGTMRYKNTNHFPRNCPFGDEEDWKWGEKLFQTIERSGNGAEPNEP